MNLVLLIIYNIKYYKLYSFNELSDINIEYLLNEFSDINILYCII